jgi:exosortase A
VSAAPAATDIAGSPRRLLVPGIGLGVGLAVLGIAFSAEIAAAVRVWLASTAFNHCLLVLPIAAYLLYEKRDVVAAAVPEPAPLIAAAAVPVGFAWLVAERAGIMEARQLLAMVLLQVLVAAVVGPRLWRALAAPLLYLFFLVPMGAVLISPLQRFTVDFVAAGLHILGVPHFVSGVSIEIPEGGFLVAEACAGLRFLIASAAFGVFYALVVYRSPVRRLLFIGCSLAVPVVANGFRALGIVVLGHLLGSAKAAAVDHVLYGWLFFAIVSALLTFGGLPFRERWQAFTGRPTTAAKLGPRAAGVAILIVAGSALLPRIVADRLDSLAVQADARSPVLLHLPAGCLPVRSAQVFPPLPRSAEAALTRTYRCGTLAVRLVVFPPSVGAGPVFAAWRRASTIAGWDETQSRTLASGPADAPIWRISDLGRESSFATLAAALWIGGRPSAGGLASRFRQAMFSLRGSAAPPLVAIVSTQPGEAAAPARAAVERFVAEVNALSGVTARQGTRRGADENPPPSGRS